MGQKKGSGKVTRYRYQVVTEQNSVALCEKIDQFGQAGWRLQKLELATSAGAILYVAVMEQKEGGGKIE